MRNANLIIIFIVAFLCGGILTFLGIVIKYFKAGNILNFFDEKKQDKEKVSKIVGRDFIVIGLSVIGIAFASIFVDKKYYNAIAIFQTITIIVGVLISLYHQIITCRKKE